MTQYIIRRLLLIPPTFLGITLIVFTITRFVPGGPVERIIAQMNQANAESGSSNTQSEPPLSEEQIAELNEYYGFNKPVLVAYGEWLWKVIKLDLGTSSRYSDPVWDTIKERFPISLFYGLTSMFLTYLICLPLGVMKAIKHESWIDNVSSILVFTGYAIPSYVVAVILLVVFGSELEWFPLGGFVSDDFEDFTFFEQVKDLIYHSVLPMTAYVMGSFAVTTVMMKIH